MERVSKTAVFKVAKAWDAASLESLLEARPELVAATDPKGRTALHMVCNVKPGGAGLGEPNDRAGSPSDLWHPRRGPQRPLPIYRGLLQFPPPAFGPGLHQPSFR
jgi:hypothetical protein